MKNQATSPDEKRRLVSGFLGLRSQGSEPDDFDDMFCMPLMNLAGNKSKSLRESRELQRKCSLYEPHSSGWCKYCMSIREFDREEVWSTICKNDTAKEQAAITKAIDDI